LAAVNSSVPVPVLVIVPAPLISPLMVSVPAAEISRLPPPVATLALIVASLFACAIVSLTVSVPVPPLIS
jgi:hypothetical protein